MSKPQLQSRQRALSFTEKIKILEKLRDRSIEVNRTERLRRVLILCCHFIQNLAFFRAGWNEQNGQKILAQCNSQFWVAANGNFLDQCVLEWCKLFADQKGKYYWGNIVSDATSFEESLLLELGWKTFEFADYVERVRHYRDKFVAHLDSEKVMHIPELEVAKNTVLFYQKYVLNKEAQATRLLGPDFGSHPCYDLSALYERRLVEAREEYKRLT